MAAEHYSLQVVGLYQKVGLYSGMYAARLEHGLDLSDGPTRVATVIHGIQV